MNGLPATIGDAVVRPIGTRDPGRNPDVSFIYVDIASVDNETKRITSPERLLGRDAPSRARQVIRAGDVLVATTRPYLNAVALVPTQLDGQVCSTGFAVLRPSNRLDSDYLFHFVRHPDFVGALAAMVQGALYPAVTDSQVLAQSIPLPPLDEQRGIAARLTAQLAAVEHARAAAAAQGHELADLRGRSYELAFGADVPFSASATVPSPPPGWRWSLLTDIARLESGHTPSRNHPEWWGGDVPWLALPDIRALDGQVVLETTEYTNPDGIAHSAARILPEGTVALSRTASVGFVTIFGRPMATSQDFVNWVCGPDMDPRFLMHLLIRSREAIRALSSGAVHKTVYYPTVKQFRICAPPIEEQRRVVEGLEAQLAVVDRSRRAVAAESEALDALPAALLRQAFSDA